MTLDGQTVRGLTVYCVNVDAIATLKADIVYLLIFKTTVDDVEWSDSRRVDSVLCRCNCHIEG